MPTSVGTGAAVAALLARSAAGPMRAALRRSGKRSREILMVITPVVNPQSGTGSPWHEDIGAQ
jgi:hypothetical protein